MLKLMTLLLIAQASPPELGRLAQPVNTTKSFSWQACGPNAGITLDSYTLPPGCMAEMHMGVVTIHTELSEVGQFSGTLVFAMHQEPPGIPGWMGKPIKYTRKQAVQFIAYPEQASPFSATSIQGFGDVLLE